MSPGRISRQTAFEALVFAIEIGEENLRDICRRHTFDYWLPLVRRLPMLLPPRWSDVWIGYAQLGIAKWSTTESGDAFSVRADVASHDIVAEVTEDDLFKCCSIATIGRILSQLHSLCRWVGKGADIVHVGNGEVELSVDDQVKEAVQAYETRRPVSPLTADRGLFVEKRIPEPNEIATRPLVSLGKKEAGPIEIELLNSAAIIQVHFLILPVSDSWFFSALQPYEEAVIDLFGIGTRSIFSVLQAFSRLVLGSIPYSDNDDVFSFEDDWNNATFRHKLGFLVGLLRKGYVRLPTDVMRESLLQAMIASGSPESTASGEIDAFLSAFSAMGDRQDAIEIRVLRPLSVVFQSTLRQTYIDLLWLDDFVAWIIDESRAWFSSQHGDRFTLALKRYIELLSPEVHVVSWKRRYQGRSLRREVDLLIRKKEKYYAVECKAIAKSRDFWLGDPAAIRRRSAKIANAARQAEAASVAAFECLVNDGSLNPEEQSIEWVLCLPTQEYIYPTNKYGFLSGTIPRVCTPRELVSHLT